MRQASLSALLHREGDDLDFEEEDDIPDEYAEDSLFAEDGTEAEDLETAGTGGFESDEEDLGSEFDDLRSGTTDSESLLGDSKSAGGDFTTGEFGSDKGMIKSDSEDLDSGKGGLDDFFFDRTFSTGVMPELLLLSSLNRL